MPGHFPERDRVKATQFYLMAPQVCLHAAVPDNQPNDQVSRTAGGLPPGFVGGRDPRLGKPPCGAVGLMTAPISFLRSDPKMADLFISGVRIQKMSRPDHRTGEPRISKETCLKVHNDKGQELSVSFDNSLGAFEHLSRSWLIVFESPESETKLHESYSVTAREFNETLTKFLNGEFTCTP